VVHRGRLRWVYVARDAAAYSASCRELSIPAYIEISRSGEGVHVWTFFDSPIAASVARQLASAAIICVCAWHRKLAFASYDRLFPSQDTLPKGGFVPFLREG